RFFFVQAEDGIRDRNVTGVQTCALPISRSSSSLLPFPARGGTLDGAVGGEVALFRFVARLGGFGFQVDILAFGLLDVLVEEAGGIGRASCRDRGGGGGGGAGRGGGGRGV